MSRLQPRTQRATHLLGDGKAVAILHVLQAVENFGLDSDVRLLAYARRHYDTGVCIARAISMQQLNVWRPPGSDPDGRRVYERLCMQS